MLEYGRLIRSVVLRVAGSDAHVIAEDVEQRILLSLWRAAGAGREIRNPGSYIYRTAVRETVRAVREEHRRRERLESVVTREDPRARTPEELAADRELVRQVEAALRELSPDRERAVRAHLAGFSVREIMETFDWSYNRARNLISRGMADLRRRLRARGLEG